MADALFGDSGRREERTEWALRYSEDSPRAGVIRPLVGEEHGRRLMGRSPVERPAADLVRRSVVTYTTPWEADHG